MPLPGAAKTVQPGFARGKCIEATLDGVSLDSRVAGLPMNPVPLSPQAVGLWMLSHGTMSLQESIERLILSPGWGKVRRSRIRGSRVAANHQNAYYVI